MNDKDLELSANIPARIKEAIAANNKWWIERLDNLLEQYNKTKTEGHYHERGCDGESVYYEGEYPMAFSQFVKKSLEATDER